MNVGLILTLAAFVFVAVALFTNCIPGWVASGISIMVLWAAGVIDQSEAFVNFTSQNIICCIGLQIYCAALLKTDILNVIAGFVKKAKGGIYILMFAVMLVPFFLCQFIGGITAMITVIPLAMGLAEAADISPTLVVLPASVGAQAGLIGLPIGMGATEYMMRNEQITTLGGSDFLDFWDLTISRLPATLLIFAFVAFVGWKLLPRRGLADQSALQNSGKALQKSELPKWKQYTIYAIFIAIIVLMSNSRSWGISNIMIACVAAFLVISLGFIKPNEVWRSVNWDLIMFMGFMLALTTAMSNSGAADILAKLVSPIYSSGNTWIAVGGTYLLVALLTQVMDNNALLNVFIPICIAAAVETGINTAAVVMAVFASSLVSFCTPLASPSSLLAYQLGGYNMKEMMKFNAPLLLIATVASVIFIPLYCML